MGTASLTSQLLLSTISHDPVCRYKNAKQNLTTMAPNGNLKSSLSAPQPWLKEPSQYRHPRACGSAPLVEPAR